MVSESYFMGGHVFKPHNHIILSNAPNSPIDQTIFH